MRYLISGYYGEGNLGDEAILAGILQEVETLDSHARFTVLSFDPGDTKRRHGVSSAPTSLRRPARLAELMRGHDLLISGGGSFLHEADFEQHGRSFLWREGKLRPVPYFLSVIFVARSLGLPVMWYAQRSQPLRVPHDRQAEREGNENHREEIGDGAQLSLPPQERTPVLLEVGFVQESTAAADKQIVASHQLGKPRGAPKRSRGTAHAVAALGVAGIEGKHREPRVGVESLDLLQDAGQDGLVSQIPLAVVAADQVSHPAFAL